MDYLLKLPVKIADVHRRRLHGAQRARAPQYLGLGAHAVYGRLNKRPELCVDDMWL